MSIIAKLLAFVRVERNGAKISDVKIDLGGGNNITAEHFSAPGDDSFPLITDYVLAADIPRNGGKVIHGYIDPINDPIAQEGDKRIYGRNKDTGISVNEVWLKSDGSIIMSNTAGSITLQADGKINLNGVTIDTNGNVISPATIGADTVKATTSLKVATKEVNGHSHLAGIPPANTGPF